MANDQNQCNFTGRLGADPESRQLSNGNVANFRIAVGKQWKDKQSQEKKERTTWVSCVAYGSLADIISRYATKGMHVRVTGEMNNRQWEHDGQTRYATEIVVSEFQMLGGQGNGGAGGQSGQGRPAGQQQTAQRQQQSRPAPQGQAGGYTNPPADYDDEIPF